MGLILRVDVDKPYGNSNIIRKIFSKVIEDFIPIPFIGTYGYLSHLKEFIEFCNSENISAFFYHRNCTRPDQQVIELLKKGGHKLGLHSENTKTFECFEKEVLIMRKKVNGINVDSFSKHGSGVLKLGKNHFPSYEPEKYREWALKVGINYFSGNNIATNEIDLDSINGFYPSAFWIEREYRDPFFKDIKEVVEIAKKKDIIILIHPCNYESTQEVKDDFKLLIQLVKENGIKWKVF